jgi:hypothetical protein
VLGGYLILLITANSGLEKAIGLESFFLGEKNIQNQRTAGTLKISDKKRTRCD